jgi:hypothetical protein
MVRNAVNRHYAAWRTLFTEKCSEFDLPRLSCPRLRIPRFGVAAGRFMQSFKVILALLAPGIVCTRTGAAQPQLGAQGAEGEPNRMPQWRVPSPGLAGMPRALLFRPPGDGPFRLALIAHASTQNALRRAQMPQPEYRALAGRLVSRGFAVLVPERPGHGATGGKYLEDQGGCDDAEYARAGGKVALAVLAASGGERHWLAETEAGVKIAGPELDRALKAPAPPAAKRR